MKNTNTKLIRTACLHGFRPSMDWQKCDFATYGYAGVTELHIVAAAPGPR